MSCANRQTPASCTAAGNSLAQSADGWQQAMRDAITDVDTLFARLDLPTEYKAAAHRSAELFGLRVPESYVARMRRGDIDDPLLRQVLPLAAEQARVPGFGLDAVGDHASHRGDGLLHKYHGRALLVTTGACAIHCRYCFRRHFDYADTHAGGHHENTAIETIASDPTIAEIILSGGDPLSLSNARLERLGQALDGIDHVQRLRIHTRTAVVLPSRIDDGLIDWLGRRRARCVVVIHANHPNELSEAVAAGLRRIAGTGALVLNQAVLLAGVNDNADILARLSLRLFDAGVLPYYLHTLDRVAGTSHYEVEGARTDSLMHELAAQLPGYLVPKLAREAAGEPAKTVLFP